MPTLGTDNTRLVLKSGKLYITTWVTPNLIGTNNVLPNSYAPSPVEVGSVKRGTQVVNLPAEYVEAIVGTPGKAFAKDPTRLKFSIEGEIYEVSAELLALLHNRNTLIAYSITSPSVQNWDITFLGSDINPIAANGYLIQSTDRSGKNFEVAMYYGISTPEDWAVNMSGDDYVVTKFMLEATPHPAFTTLAQDKQNYGYIARQNS